MFTSGPWRPEDGDPGHPDTVYGIPVVERLGEDPDGGRSLVRLADQRYALTGSSAVIGPFRKLDRYLRRRRRDLIDERWYQEAREFVRRGTAAQSTTGR
jgi:hypothetical protein